jgi:thiosulfate/3-mercaptopyruvate sulfurtransferase
MGLIEIMQYRAFTLGLLLATPSVFAAAPLLTPQELAPLLEQPQVRVIDIRDAQGFTTNHIPNAVNAPYGQWRGPANNPGDVPAQDKLVALVQQLGLSADTHAVVVSTGKDATDFGASARVYWTLKSLGLKELSIVNGGMQAWEAAKLPLTQTATVIAPTTFAPTFDSRWLATRDQVVQHVQKQDALLLDSRPAAFYNGETQAPAAKAAGTLPGAQHFDFNQWFTPGSSAFIQASAAQVTSKINLPGATENKPTVAFCNTGHWAATEWFALSEIAGQPNTKLYAGSMVDWTQAPQALPLENAPSRGTQLARAVQGWFNNLVD